MSSSSKGDDSIFSLSADSEAEDPGQWSSSDQCDSCHSDEEGDHSLVESKSESQTAWSNELHLPVRQPRTAKELEESLASHLHEDSVDVEVSEEEMSQESDASSDEVQTASVGSYRAATTELSED
jgi:hypothetical protein